jgi:signal transduction histidine kinase
MLDADGPFIAESWHEDTPGAASSQEARSVERASERESDGALNLPPPPTVGASRIRFCAGVPIPGGDGAPDACLCVFGYHPRRVADSERQCLSGLGDLLGDALSRGRRASQFDAAFASPNILAWSLAPDGTIETANDAALDAVNATRGDVVGLKIWNGPWWRYNPAERDTVLLHVREAVRQGTHRDFFPGTDLRSGGRTFTTRTTICPVRGPGGGLSGLLLLAFKTTEQRHRTEQPEKQRLTISTYLHQAEEELLTAKNRSAQAKKELDARTRMLATLSHEVRTPLTSVIGFANTIGSDLHVLREEGPPDGQTVGDVLATLGRFAHLIEESGERLLSALDGVLTLSKIETGQLDLSPHVLDACSEVRTIAAQMEPEAEKTGIALTVTCPDPVQVWADRDGLDIVLRNLISNALKYTEAGGRAEVRVSSATGVSIIEIEDTGIGMDPDELPDLLQSFHRGTSPLVDEQEGVGLGLSLVQQIVAEMDGSLNIDTAPGRGTTVTVRLPATESAPGSKAD